MNCTLRSDIPPGSDILWQRAELSLRDTCRDELRGGLSKEWMARCEDFIEVGKEKHHFKTLNRQKEKFNRLLQQKHIKDKCKSLHGIHIVSP